MEIAVKLTMNPTSSLLGHSMPVNAYSPGTRAAASPTSRSALGLAFSDLVVAALRGVCSSWIESQALPGSYLYPGFWVLGSGGYQAWVGIGGI